MTKRTTYKSYMRAVGRPTPPRNIRTEKRPGDLELIPRRTLRDLGVHEHG